MNGLHLNHTLLSGEARRILLAEKQLYIVSQVVKVFAAYMGKLDQTSYTYT